MTNLNAADVDTNPYTGQVRRTNPSLNASISALDLPLPNKPMQMSTPYGHGQNDFLSLDENVAYTTNRDIDSRPPFPPPYSMSPPQSHLYEQLDVAIAESSAFWLLWDVYYVATATVIIDFVSWYCYNQVYTTAVQQLWCTRHNNLH